MRLICGLVQLDGASADPAVVRAMAGAMTPLGLRPRLALKSAGPAALAILDFAQGSADGPFDLLLAEDGTWIAADARLDESVDLAQAVMRHGADLPDRLRGDFALAAWTPRQRRLICARDFVGVRPLAWHHRPGRLFAFASLPKGLIGAGLASAMPDLVGLGRLLAEPYGPGDRTSFMAVSRLRAGCALIVTPSGLRQHRAFDPDVGQVGTRRISHADAVAEMRHLVEAAVRCRLPAAGPVAAQLSGGLDSSAIAVIAARMLHPQGRRVHVFSLLAQRRDGIEDGDERPYVEAVLAQEPELAWQAFHPAAFDDPDPGDGDLPPVTLGYSFSDQTCAAAAAAGSAILLTGAGGDEGATYNGAAIHAALLRQGNWRPLLPELRALAKREQRPLARVVFDRLMRPLVPGRLTETYQRLRGRTQPLRHRQLAALEFLTPDLRRSVAATLSANPMWRNRPVDRIDMFVNSYVVGRNDHWSILAARHGVAVSAPLLDRRIVDFALSLPLERFLAGGLSRQPFRDAMIGILPEPVRLRVSKATTTPGDLLRLAVAKPALLAQAEALRGSAAADHVDLDQIAAAFAAAPDRDQAWQLARLNGPPPLSHKRAVRAVTALAIARHIARWS